MRADSAKRVLFLFSNSYFAIGVFYLKNSNRKYFRLSCVVYLILFVDLHI